MTPSRKPFLVLVSLSLMCPSPLHSYLRVRVCDKYFGLCSNVAKPLVLKSDALVNVSNACARRADCSLYVDSCCAAVDLRGLQAANAAHSN